MKWLTRYFILIFCILQTNLGFAQNTIEEVNEIKLSGKYFVGEAYDGTEDAAKSAAKLDLMNTIREYCNKQEINAPSEDAVKKITKEMMVKLDGLYMAFVYAPKADLVSTSSAAVATLPTSQNSVSTNSSSSSNSNSSVSNSNTNSSASSSNNSSSVSSAANSPETVSSAANSPETVSSAANSGNALNFTALPKIITNLLLLETFSSTEFLLNQALEKGDVTEFGKVRQVANPDECYIILFNEQRYVETVLGPKNDGKRKNLKTNVIMGNEELRTYSRCFPIYIKTK